MPTAAFDGSRVVVAITERPVRLAIAQSLAHPGRVVSPVSRVAELAKTLRDGPAPLIVTSDHIDDVAMAAPLRAATVGAWLVVPYDAPLAVQMGQIHDALAGGASASAIGDADDQPTLSA